MNFAKIFKISLFVVAVILAVVVWRKLHPSEEARIIGRCEKLADCLSKSPGEGNSVMALKMNALGGLFADTFTVAVAVSPVTGSLSSSEAVGLASRARGMASEINLKFYDIQVDIESANSASVMFTARVNATLKNNERHSETGEVHARLGKNAEGNWVFEGFSEEVVLEH